MLKSIKNPILRYGIVLFVMFFCFRIVYNNPVRQFNSESKQIEANSDLATRRVELDKEYERLTALNPTDEVEVTNAISSFQKFGEEVRNYTAESINRGIDKNNDKILLIVDNSIAKLQSLKSKFQKEKESEQRQFDILSCTEDKLWEFVQGEWHASNYSSGVSDYFKIRIDGRHVVVKKYSHVEGVSTETFSDKNNAPFETFIECDLESLNRQYVDGHQFSDGTYQVQNEDRAYLNFPKACNDKDQFFLRRRRSTYADKPNDNEVEFMAGIDGVRVYFSKGLNF